MIKIQKVQRKIVIAIIALVAINVLLAINTAVSLSTREIKTYSAANYALKYDDTKLAIKNVDGLTYDSSGNIDSFNLTIQNNDPTIAHSGIVEVSVSNQTSTNSLPTMNPDATTKITISLNPNLPVSPPVQISATIILSGGN